MRRTVLAFLIAPLWVPAGAWPYAAYMFPYPGQQHWILMTTIVATVFAYGGTAALGIPAFLLLRARKYTSFWIAPVLGFAAGVATWQVFLVLFGLSLGHSWSFVLRELVNGSARLDNYLPAGPLGSAIGATLWLVARPDRHA